jgi:hypothetical protein
LVCPEVTTNTHVCSPHFIDGKVGQSGEWTTRRSMKMIVKAQWGSNGVNLKFAITDMATAPPMISKTRAKTAHAVLPYADVLAHGYCSFGFRIA